MTAAFPSRSASVALLAGILWSAGCVSVGAPPQPVPTPRWEPVDVDHTSSVRKLARELGMAVRRDGDVHSIAIEGEYGRIVFLDGTREILVAGRRIEAGETIRVSSDDVPLLTADAAAIRRAWQEEVAETRTREAEPTDRRLPRGVAGRKAAIGPADPAWGVPLKREWEGILLHHSATDIGNLAQFDKFHREVNGWRMIGYDFVICNGDGGPDGLVETTERWKQQIEGAHAKDKRYNEHWIGICLVGNFNETKPTPKQLASLRRLVHFLQAYCGIPEGNIQCHRDVRDTDCPGRKFPMREVLAESPRGM